MQVTSLLSRTEAEAAPNHEPEPDHAPGAECSTCGHDHEHEHAPVRLPQTLIGLIFVLNAFVVDRMFDRAAMVANFSAMIGALILGAPIVWTSFKDIQRGLLSINELVGIAVLAAFASGRYEMAGLVAFFMLMGEIIESRTAAGARASIESLIKLTPTKARRLLPGGTEEEVAARDLAVGDVIRIRPGDNVAADGVIVNGQGSFNQANITGESLPVDKKPGDEVFAGTQNLTGVLEIRVNRAGQDTTLGRVRELILAAEKTRLPIMRIVDQYMSFYTPLVLVIGALVWAFSVGVPMDKRLDRVISVLIVSCPCAFILATPTAMVAALSAAARLGILIKNVGDIEAAARINAFIFDKTGTLTTGNLSVSRLAPLDGTTPAELLRVAASAEKYSNHPTAKALAALADEAGVPLPEPRDFSETAGRGIKARVEGDHVIVGRAQWLMDNGVKDDFAKSVDLNETEGFSLIFVARKGHCIGWIGLRDEVRGNP
jgi:Zn2+/Cd2+-exporting ATPase